MQFSFVQGYGLFLQQLARPGSDIQEPAHYNQQFFQPTADASFLQAKIKEAAIENWWEGYAQWTSADLNPDAPVLWAGAVDWDSNRCGAIPIAVSQIDGRVEPRYEAFVAVCGRTAEREDRLGVLQNAAERIESQVVETAVAGS